MQIPNGFKFRQPETGWEPTRFASFNVIVQNLIAHRRGRPDLIAQHGWATDQDSVEQEVEQFNVRLCLQHNWTEYLDGMMAGGDLPPKSRPPSALESQQVNAAGAKAKKIWSGVRTLNDWIDSGEPAVPPELSHSRAAICAICPKNTAGDFTAWFTKPAAAAIKSQVEKLEGRKLSTPSDSKINICGVCLCPLKLKVHTPMLFVKAHMSESVLKDLQQVSGCWIVKEMEAENKPA